MERHLTRAIYPQETEDISKREFANGMIIGVPCRTRGSYLANSMNNEDNKKLFFCAEKALNDFHITKYFYNLSGYSDDKVCLESDPTNSDWILYYGFRTEKENLQRFKTLRSALLGLFERLAKSIKMKEDLIKRFDIYLRQLNLLNKQPSFYEFKLNDFRLGNSQIITSDPITSYRICAYDVQNCEIIKADQNCEIIRADELA